MHSSDPAVSVSEAVRSRRSVRGYLDRPVDGARLREILRLSSRAPSGCNLQPCYYHIVGGDALGRLKAIMRGRVQEFPKGEPTEYDILPADLPAVYNHRRVEAGFGLYESLGIARDDRAARTDWQAYNLQLFGAPVGLFCSIDRRLGPSQ